MLLTGPGQPWPSFVRVGEEVHHLCRSCWRWELTEGNRLDELCMHMLLQGLYQQLQPAARWSTGQLALEVVAGRMEHPSKKLNHTGTSRLMSTPDKFNSRLTVLLCECQVLVLWWFLETPKGSCSGKVMPGLPCLTPVQEGTRLGTQFIASQLWESG